MVTGPRANYATDAASATELVPFYFTKNVSRNGDPRVAEIRYNDRSWCDTSTPKITLWSFSRKHAMWRCPQCAESIDSEWEICWCCGTSRDGKIDPDFQRSVQHDDAPPAVRHSDSGFNRAFLVFSLVLSAVFGAAYPFVFHTVPEDPLKGPAATSVIPWILVILFGIAAGPLTFALISSVNAMVNSGNPPSEETGNWFFERYLVRRPEPLKTLSQALWSNGIFAIFLLFAHATSLQFPSPLPVGLWLTVPSLWLTIRYVESQRHPQKPHSSAGASPSR